MYVPGFTAVDDPAVALSLVRSTGVGHLVTGGPEGLDASVVPFLVDESLDRVRLHLARANPQWRTADGAQALLIVPASSAYVSPSWYPSKADDPRVVPTWNYEVVHLHGTVHVHDDAAWTEALVRGLTDRHEAARTDGGEPWAVDDAPADHVARLLRAVVGIELVVDRVEAKRKLSQNRSAGDQAGVADGLDASRAPGAAAVAAAMRTVEEP